MKKIDCLSVEEIKEVVENFSEQSFRGKQIYNWLYYNNVTSFDMMTNIPVSLREKLSSEYEFTYFEVNSSSCCSVMWKYSITVSISASMIILMD